MALLGYFIDGDGPKRDAFVLQLNDDGSLDFYKTYGIGENEYPYSIDETPSGNLMIFGNQDTGSTSRNFFLILDGEGNIQWTRSLFDNVIWGRGLACSDGGFVGRTSRTIYKINADGNLLWANSYNLVSPSSPPVEVEGGYIFVAFNESQNGNHFVYKLGMNGEVVWLSPGMESSGHPTLEILPNGNILCLNSSFIDGEGPFLTLTELTSDGSILSQKTVLDTNIAGIGIFMDFTLMNDGSIVFTTIGGTNGSELLIGKTNVNYDLACEGFIFDNTVATPEMEVTPKNSNINQATFEVAEPELVITEEFHNPSRSCDHFPFEFPELRADTTLCFGDTILLSAFLEGATFEWQDGSTNPEFIVSQSGTYSLKVQKCNVIHTTTTRIEFTDCPCTILNPNAFTPDGDGVNDYFKIIYDCPVSDFEMQIFNRFGELVFQSQTPEAGWGGVHDGQPAPMDVYLYKYQYTVLENVVMRQKVVKGDLTLIR